MEGYIGQIMMFGGNFAPRNWLLCQGQLLAIAQNQAFFSIIGTIYGGDGRTTFALPDLRGRSPMGSGTGPGLSPRTLGSRFGTETNTLATVNMPSHNHGVALKGETAQGDSKNPNNKLLAFVNGDTLPYANPVAADEVTMHPDSISQQNVGSGAPFNNIQPVQTLNFIICAQGIYPSRN